MNKKSDKKLVIISIVLIAVAVVCVVIAASSLAQQAAAVQEANINPEITPTPKQTGQEQTIEYDFNIDSKPASSFTVNYNKQVEESLNKESIEKEKTLAQSKLIAEKKNLVIRSKDNSRDAWDMTQYEFLFNKMPDTVNPKLWEHAKLNMNIGLYQVSENIYQIRGFDLANITFIKGNTGWIIIDPLTGEETAAAALAFINEQLGERKVSAVIYTHSHIDHYGGALGVLPEKGNAKIYAPEGFLDAVVSENLYAGVAMMRRSYFMYGTILPRGEKGQIDGGLGKYAALANNSLLRPDVYITSKNLNQYIDGVSVTFQLTPGTEAPAEMNCYIEKDKTLCIAENCTATLHNLYTLRGAEVRDPEKWADYLDETIKLFGNKTENIFSTHNWPRFGNEEIIKYIQSQRDCYQFIKDQTLRLMSLGYTIDEVGRMIALPKNLSDEFFNGEFYGTVSHNAKAVYQKYLGWYDSNPVNLNKLIPTDSAKKYIEYMGGSKAVLQKAKQDFKNGEYQWVSEVTRQIIFAEPDNTEAKLLCADALEQLGYIAESGPWRNEYLYGAFELRNGVKIPSQISVKYDVLDAVTTKQLIGMWAILLDGEKANNINKTINIVITDDKRRCAVNLRNGVLVYIGEDLLANPDISVEMNKETLYKMVSGVKIDAATDITTITDEGLLNIIELFDMPDPAFNIVTP